MYFTYTIKVTIDIQARKKEVPFQDAAEKVVNKFRGKLLGDASKEIESGEFAEELKDHFYLLLF